MRQAINKPERVKLCRLVKVVLKTPTTGKLLTGKLLTGKLLTGKLLMGKPELQSSCLHCTIAHAWKFLERPTESR
jgi:hypothetical protein